jgi:pimeloyl-ACP methyl ester carboxylesterase
MAEAWSYRHVAANGARFHVTTAGEGNPVVFLHGFPEYWWAWRHQLPAFAGAGYRAIAMDLRGYGASDKTPRGYDLLTLAADVAGTIKSLGHERAVVIGHGWGGLVAWTLAAAHPDQVSALCAVSAPHPLAIVNPRIAIRHRAAVTHLLAMQLPWVPERRIMRGNYVSRHLNAWSSPASTFPSAEAVETYTKALSQWPSPHCALEYHRWLFRSRPRADGRALKAAVTPRIDIPVLQLTGADDPVVRRPAIDASTARVAGERTDVVVPGAGHFPHEETPEVFSHTVLGWLDTHRQSSD